MLSDLPLKAIYFSTRLSLSILNASLWQVNPRGHQLKTAAKT